VHRPGLTRLLAAAESKPRPFDAVLFEDSSRLSRKQADILNLAERFNFAGVRVCFISQGIDSGDEKFQFLLMARGLVDQLFLSDTANRVRRGMEGLLSKGAAYWRSMLRIPGEERFGRTRLEVYEPEAAIVRGVFEVLNSDAIAAKSYLARHVEKIVMEPHGKMYVASGGWNLLGETLGWCRGGELNSLRRPFQGRALPVSYPGTG
jgi:site-specific DNA recombinase